MTTPRVRVWKQNVGAIYFHQYGTVSGMADGDVVFPMFLTRVPRIMPLPFLDAHYHIVREEEDGDMEGRGPDGEPLAARDPSRGRPRVPVARHSGDPA